MVFLLSERQSQHVRFWWHKRDIALPFDFCVFDLLAEGPADVVPHHHNSPSLLGLVVRAG